MNKLVFLAFLSCSLAAFASDPKAVEYQVKFEKSNHPNSVEAVPEGRVIVDLSPFGERAPTLCNWLLVNDRVREVKASSGSSQMQASMQNHTVFGWIDYGTLTIVPELFRSAGIDKIEEYGSIYYLFADKESLRVLSSPIQPDVWSAPARTIIAGSSRQFKAAGYMATQVSQFLAAVTDLESDELAPDQVVDINNRELIVKGKLVSADEFSVDQLTIRLRASPTHMGVAIVQHFTSITGKLMREKGQLFVLSPNGAERYVKVLGHLPHHFDSLIGQQVHVQGVETYEDKKYVVHVFPKLNNISFLKPQL